MAVDDSVLMDSILSMDAYNRGDTAGMVLPNSVIPGGAEIVGLSQDVLAADNPETYSFYATAYDWDGQTIIAYRGTMITGTGPLGVDAGDIENGWTVGAGAATAMQAQLAIQFYQAIAAQENPALLPGGSDAGDWQSTNIEVTGHSLGGGLAGLVGEIYGLSGDLFDSMTFNLAASNAFNEATDVAQVIDPTNGESEPDPNGSLANPDWASFVYGAAAQNPYALNASGLSAYATTGEALGDLLLAPSANYLNSYAGVPANPVDLHSSALLVLELYAAMGGQNPLTAWQAIGTSLYNAEFGTSIANALSITQQDNYLYAPNTELLTAIAYSAAPGSSPFGTTAVESYFADADTLGSLESSGQITGLLADTGLFDSITGNGVLNALSEIIVQYAGDQAWTAGQNDGSNGSATGNGIFTANAGVLAIDLDPAQWVTTYEQSQPTIVGLNDLATAIITELAPAYGLASVSLGSTPPSYYQALMDVSADLGDAIANGAITQILAGTGDLGGNLDGSNASETIGKTPGGNLIIADNGDDQITGSVGQNFIFLGAGDDVVHTTWGDDEIVSDGGDASIGINDATFNGASGDPTSTSYVISDGSGMTTVDIADSVADGFTFSADQPSPLGGSDDWDEYSVTKNGFTYSMWVEGPSQYDIALTSTSSSTNPNIVITSDSNATTATWEQNISPSADPLPSKVIGGTPAAGYGNKLNMQSYVSPQTYTATLASGQTENFTGVVFQGDKLYGTDITFKNFQILYADPTGGGSANADYISGKTDFKNIYLGNGNNVVSNLSGGVLPGQSQSLGALANWVTVNLGTGNSEVLGTTAPGSEIFAQGSTHHDIINISPDIEINGLTVDDELTYDGQVITGGTANAASGTDWYTSFNGQLQFAVDSKDELIIEPTISGIIQSLESLAGVTTAVDPATYVTNYQFADLASTGDLNSPATAGVTLVAVKYTAHMLVGGTPFQEMNAFYVYNAESLAWFGKNYAHYDPLVVDLAGTGLNFTGADTGQGPRFDVTGDGFANPSSWITPGEGYLVTVSATGQVSLVTSFAQLAAYDANDDGVIDSSDLASPADSALPELRVWVDPTSGHTPQDDDLLTLSQAGIQSISLDATATPADDMIGDVAINSTAVITLTSGATSTIGAVTLNVDYADSTWQGDDTVTANAAALPDLTGSGTLPDLRVALSLDENAQIAAGTLTSGSSTALESAIATAVANFPNVTPTLADWRQAADAVLTDWTQAFANPLPSAGAQWWDDPTDPTGAASGAANGSPDVYNLVETNADGSTTVVETLTYETFPQTIQVTDSQTGLTSSEAVTRGEWVASGTNPLDANDDVIVQPSLDEVLSATLPTNEAWQVAGSSDSYTLVEANADGSQTVVDTLEFVATPYTGDDSTGATSAGYWAFESGRGVMDANGDVISAPTLAQALATPLPAGDSFVLDGDTSESAARPNYYYVYTLDSDDVMQVVDDLEYKVGPMTEQVFDPSTDSDVSETVTAGQWVWGSGAPMQYYDSADDKLVSFTATTLDEALQAYIPSGEQWGELTAAELNFYERYTGQPVYFGDQTPNQSDWTSVMSQSVNQAVNTIDLLTLELFVQSPLNQTIFSTLTFDQSTGYFSSTSPFGLEPVYQSIFSTLSGLSGDALTSALDGWHTIMQELQSYYLPANDAVLTDGYVLAAIVAANDAAPLQMPLVDIASQLGILPSEIVSGQGTVTAGPTSGSNLFLVGPGQNTYEGSNATDEYIVDGNFGNSVIDDQDNPFGEKPADIRFATLTSDDVLLSQSGDDLIITDKLTGATLDVVNQFLNPDYETLLFLSGDGVEKYGVDDIIFANGVVWSKSDISFQTAQRGTSDDTLYGASGDDVLFGGPGDTLVGNANGEGGSTTYIYEPNMGSMTIAQGDGSPTSLENSTLLFGPGVTEDDVVFSRSPSALDDLLVTITTTGATIDIKNEYTYEYNFLLGGDYVDRVGAFAFSDGSEISADDVMNTVIDDEIASGATIYGTPSDDFIDPGVGNVSRMIYGEGGADTFVFGRGYGTVSVLAQPRALDNPNFSVVDFGAGITVDDLVLSRPADDLDNLQIAIAGTDDVLTVDNQFSVFYPLGSPTFYNQISQFNFADGTSLSADQIRALWFQQQLAAAAPTTYGSVLEGTPFDDTFALPTGNKWRILSGGDGSDTYDFNRGDGTLVIRQDVQNVFGQGTDTVAFGQGISLDDLVLTNIWNTSDLEVSIKGTDDSFIITNENGYQTLDGDFISQFTFADGSTYSAAQFEALANLSATNDNALIVSSNFDDTLVAGSGDDILVAKEMNHVFEFAPGFGNDYIVFGDTSAGPSQTATDTIQFDTGINLADLSFYNDDDSLIIHENGTGSTITVVNLSTTSAVQDLAFADGSTITVSQIEAMIAADPPPVLTATNNGQEVEAATSGTVLGGWGNFGYSSGEGTVIIDPEFDEPFTVTFNNIASTDAQLSLEGIDSNTVVFTFAGDPDDRLVVHGVNDSSAMFTFSDGVTWSAEDVYNELLAQETAAGDTIIQQPYSNDPATLVSSPGAHFLEGSLGVDTFVWSVGDGFTTIEDDSGRGANPLNTLVLHGVTPDEVSVYRDPTDNNMYLFVDGSDSPAVEVVSQFGLGAELAGGVIGSVQFDDGTTWSSLDLVVKAAGGIASTPTITAAPGETNLVGSSDDNVFDPGSGNVTMTAGSGNNVYIYRSSYGDDIINPGTALQNQQYGAIRLPDLNQSDVTFSRSDDNLTITVDSTGHTLTVSNFFVETGSGSAPGTMQGIDYVMFADGTQLTESQIEPLAWYYAGPGDAIVTSASSNATMVAGQGDDTLVGDNTYEGNTADTFVYGSTDGSLTIDSESGSYDIDNNTLRLTDLNIGDVMLSRSGDDLLIGVNATGKTITIDDEFVGWAYNGIQAIEFADGTTWQWTHVGEFYASSDGSVSIDNDGSAFTGVVLTDLLSSDISLSRNGSSDDVVVTVAATGATITLQDELDVSHNSQAIAVSFADGSTWSLAQLEQTLLAEEASQTWGSIYAAGQDDTIVSGPGNNYIYGLGLTNTYVYSSADGSDVIDDGGNHSTLVFTDLSAADIALSRNGASDDLVITVKSTGKTITVQGEFSYWQDGALQAIQFADGTSWTLAQLEQNLLAQESAATSGSVYGYSSANETIVAGPGDKYLNGLGAADTYVYSSVDGDDVIDDGGNRSSLVFSDLDPTDVTLSRDGSSNDLVITVDSTDKTITVLGEFSYWQQGALQTIGFADGTTWSLSQIEQLLLAQESAASSGSVYGYSSASETIVAGPGNKYLNGLGAADTYVYSSADGDDVIDDGGNQSNLVLSDLNPDGVTLSRDGSSNDLIITVNSTGKTITVLGEFSYWQEGALQTIGFADGTTWSLAQVEQLLLAQESAAISGSVYGYSSANETIVAGSGNKYLNGLGAADTYVYSSADGDDVIDDGGDRSSLAFTDLNPADITLSRIGASDDMLITVNSTGRTITVRGEYSYWEDGTLNAIEFADGAVWSQATILGMGASYSVAEYLANQQALDASGGIEISDNAANIAASLDALNNDPAVTSIALTDGGPLILTVAQALNDTAALNEISNSSYAIEISDTAANVSAALDALNADTHVTSISLTDAGSLSLTAAQALDDSTALGEIANSGYSVSIVDTAADVSAEIDALDADTRIAEVTLSDGETPILTLSAAQAASETAVLNAITNADYTIAISDTAANVSANFDALSANSRIVSITLTDGGTPTLTLTASQALNDTSALNEITNSNYAIAIADTSTNIAATFDALNADLRISAIILTDGQTPLLTLTAAQGASDQTALGEIGNANFAVNYIDVSGLGYTSYEDLYSGGAEIAEAQNLSGGGGALNLHGDGLTISSSAGQTSVSAGSAIFGVGANVNETISTTGLSNETFAFSSGFGQSAISGFQVGGVNGDALQFDVSMFDYLTTSMSQAEDIAAVLGQAAQSGANLVISDSAGDAVTLNNIAKDSLANNPSAMKFV